MNHQDAAPPLTPGESLRRSELFARLKRETLGLHEEAMSCVPLLRPHLTIDVYRAHLRQLIGIYLPLEEDIKSAMRTFGDPFQMPRRYKSAWLKADLLALGETPEAIATLPQNPSCVRFEGIAELIGTLYVLEGSTLGGQVIQRMLRERLALPEQWMHFYRGYGKDTAAMWNSFRATAQALVPADEIPRAIGSARFTFRLFIEWLSQAPT